MKESSTKAMAAVLYGDKYIQIITDFGRRCLFL